MKVVANQLILFYFKKDFIYVLSETVEGREKERERNINVPEKHQLVERCARDV